MCLVVCMFISTRRKILLLVESDDVGRTFFSNGSHSKIAEQWREKIPRRRSKRIGLTSLLMYMRHFARLFSAMAGPRPVVFSGPSGAGKSTLLKRLLEEYNSVFGFSVSHTTRNPRPGEENGRDYHYVTREEMQAGIDNGDFIENAEFSGNLYGTSKAAVQAVQAKNLICILDIDMQGVKNIKRTDLNPIYISIQPPSMEVLEKRLRERKTESEESLQKRLHAAKVDMEFSKEAGAFDVIIVNNNLEDAYGKLKQTLLEEINKVKKLSLSS